MKNQDLEVIDSIQKGDRKLFRVLVERYTALVIGFLRTFRPPESMVEDIAQETFIKAYLNIDKFRPVKSFTAWLLMIARNTMIDAIRKQNRDKNMPPELPTIDFRTPESEVTGAVEYQRMTENLDAADKLLIDLRIIQDLPFPEVSELMGINVNALRVRLHRLLSRLRLEVTTSEKEQV